MRPRSELHDLLKSLVGSGKVYFQPPSGMSMEYPCITYERNSADTKFADNLPYRYEKQYSITVIDKNPDSLIPDRVAKLPQCTFDRQFKSDNMNHDVFRLYF
jgi:hypothetical protein